MLSNSLASSYFFHIFLRKFIETLKNYKTCVYIILFECSLFIRINHEVIIKCIDLFRSNKNMLDISNFKCCLYLIELLTCVDFSENKQLS